MRHPSMLASVLAAKLQLLKLNPMYNLLCPCPISTLHSPRLVSSDSEAVTVDNVYFLEINLNYRYVGSGCENRPLACRIHCFVVIICNFL